MKIDFCNLLKQAKPNPAHYIAKVLKDKGKLMGVVTQNIDGLYVDAGLEISDLLELHGQSRNVVCISCHEKFDFSEAEEQWNRGITDIRCPSCKNGILKPTTVFFGQALDSEVLEKAKQWHSECDLLIVMGSALKVSPANQLPVSPLARKIPVIIMNIGDTPFDEYATIIFNEKVGELSQKLIDLL